MHAPPKTHHTNSRQLSQHTVLSHCVSSLSRARVNTRLSAPGLPCTQRGAEAGAATRPAPGAELQPPRRRQRVEQGGMNGAAGGAFTPGASRHVHTPSPHTYTLHTRAHRFTHTHTHAHTGTCGTFHTGSVTFTRPPPTHTHTRTFARTHTRTHTHTGSVTFTRPPPHTRTHARLHARTHTRTCGSFPFSSSFSRSSCGRVHTGGGGVLHYIYTHAQEAKSCTEVQVHTLHKSMGATPLSQSKGRNGPWGTRPDLHVDATRDAPRVLPALTSTRTREHDAPGVNPPLCAHTSHHIYRDRGLRVQNTSLRRDGVKRIRAARPGEALQLYRDQYSKQEQCVLETRGHVDWDVTCDAPRP